MQSPLSSYVRRSDLLRRCPKQASRSQDRASGPTPENPDAVRSRGGAGLTLLRFLGGLRQTQMLVVERNQLPERLRHGLRLGVQVVVRPALQDDERYLLGAGAPDDLAAIPIGAKSADLVTDDDH